MMIISTPIIEHHSNTRGHHKGLYLVCLWLNLTNLFIFKVFWFLFLCKFVRFGLWSLWRLFGFPLKMLLKLLGFGLADEDSAVFLVFPDNILGSGVIDTEKSGSLINTHILLGHQFDELNSFLNDQRGTSRQIKLYLDCRTTLSYLRGFLWSFDSILIIIDYSIISIVLKATVY